MVLFSRYLYQIVHGKYYWAEIIAWYLLCLVAPHCTWTFNVHWFVHNFNTPGTLEWFLFDFVNVSGIFLGFRGLFLFGYYPLYKLIAQVVMIDMAYEMVDLIILDNQFNVKSLIFQNAIVITAIVHALYHYKRK